jgi:hypothetical protein
MQIANILLALGGNSDSTVPKYGVTPAEVAVLRQIHGEDSVTDVEPVGDVERPNRDERKRLAEAYGRRDPTGRHLAPAVDALFPGVASRVFETFDELDLPEEFYKAATRVSARPPRESEPVEVAPAAPAAEPKKPSKKAAAAAAAKAAAEAADAAAAEAAAAAQAEAEGDDGDDGDDEAAVDGIADIDDEHAGKVDKNLFS